MEDRLHRHIIKSRPYFDEKALCQDQLNTQKERIETLKSDILKSKTSYSQSLKQLEQISREIHMKRQGFVENDILNRPREPGVGAELSPKVEEGQSQHSSLPDFNLELDKCEIHSMGSCSGTASSAVSEKDESEVVDEDCLEELKLKVKELAVRPIDGGGEGKSTDNVWENELKSTVDKLDHMLMMKECANELNNFKLSSQYTTDVIKK